MIELKKRSLFSSEYVARDNGVVVGELSRSKWRDQGRFTVQGRDLKLKREGALKDTFTLFDGDAAILQVKQPRVLRHKLEFQYDGRDFAIRDKAWYSSTVLVESGGSLVGSVRKRGLFSTGATVDLPDSLPLAVRVFVGWIAMVRWDAAAAAVAVRVATG